MFLPSAVPFSLQQPFVSALADFSVASRDFSVGFWLPDSCMEALLRDERGQWQVSFYLWNRERSAAHPKSTGDKPPKAEKSKTADVLCSAWME